MVDAGSAVCRRRTLVEDPLGGAFALLQGGAEDVFVPPPLEHRFFERDEVERWIYRAEHRRNDTGAPLGDCTVRPASLRRMRRCSLFFRAAVCSAVVLASGVVGSVVAATPAVAASAHDAEVFAFGTASFHGSTATQSLSRPIVAMASTANGVGYWLVANDGGVFSFNAPFFGALAGWPLAQPVTGMTATPSGHGYWIVTADGAVFPFGDAHVYGSLFGTHLNAPIKALIPGPGGAGYWLYASDGGVFSFGSARFHGSTGAMRLNAPVVGMSSTPTGNGYWLVASDGGIFTFGDAVFQGSTGDQKLNQPIVGMASTPTGNGYWFVAADGGIFSFGDAAFHGSTGGQKLNAPIAGMAATPTGNGYWFVATDGGVFTFGDAAYHGALAGQPAGTPVIGIDATPAGDGYWLATGDEPGTAPGPVDVTCYSLQGRPPTGQHPSAHVGAGAPDVIPLGTRLEIEGVGVRPAADPGGAIQGRRLDIWKSSSSACADFGRQPLNVPRLD